MINQEVIVMPVKYLPSINWFAAAGAKKTIKFLNEENYRKENHANRCSIASSNGIIQLTVPLAGGRNQKANIYDLKIAGVEWKRNHLNAIKSAYGKAPYFIYYLDQFEQIILNSNNQFSDLCLTLINWLNKEFQTENRIVASSVNETETVISNKKARQYHQVFENKFGFQNNLSAIDLLFSTGPDAKNYLTEN